MADADRELMSLAEAIVARHDDIAFARLAAKQELATARFERGATRGSAAPFFLAEIGRYAYAGDTLLHIAAAAYQRGMVQRLLAAGADIRARNRRGAEPIHAAAVGLPGSPAFDPTAQVATIACLIDAGADPNAQDMDGVTPLHRAVRTCCAAAVEALLTRGADPRRKNKRGSTPVRLATLHSGRGGSGSPEAKAERAAIVRLLRGHAG